MLTVRQRETAVFLQADATRVLGLMVDARKGLNGLQELSSHEQLLLQFPTADDALADAINSLMNVRGELAVLLAESDRAAADV